MDDSDSISSQMLKGNLEFHPTLLGVHPSLRSNSLQNTFLLGSLLVSFDNPGVISAAQECPEFL